MLFRRSSISHLNRSVRFARSRQGLPGFLLAVLLFLSASNARAQWMTQSIQLHPGWNSVFIEVEPEPRTPAQLFQGIPVESAWAWNDRFSTIQFLQDPNTLVPESPEWLHYYPASNPASFGNNLFLVTAGSPLLIKLAGDAPVTWNVAGMAHFGAIHWIPNSFNLTGFYVDPASPPTFTSYFAPSAAHVNQPMHRLNAQGDWELITDPQTRTVNPGEAYWIYCNGTSRYAGPLLAESDLGFALEFERVLTKLPVRVKNSSGAARNITFSLLPSGNPPSEGLPQLAGPVPLSYFDGIFPGGLGEWQEFSGALSLSLGSAKSTQLQLQVRRKDLLPFGGDPGASYLYEGILQITDGAGSRIRFPLSAEDTRGDGLTTAAGRPSLAVTGNKMARMNIRQGATPSVNVRAGLWEGTVTLHEVSQPSNVGDPNVVRPASGGLTFRILVHVDANGAAKFLQQVYLLFEEGTLIDDPNDPSIPPGKIVDAPGRFVLVTSESSIANFTGSLIRDGEAVGRRYSTTAFAFKDPLPMTSMGAFGDIGSKVGVTVSLPYNDPLNPFFHKFHPDHDNKDRRFQNDLGAGFESFNISRNVELEMTSSVPDGLPAVGIGDKLLVGTYRETITGLHKQAINIRGTFRLDRVSLVDTISN